MSYSSNEVHRIADLFLEPFPLRTESTSLGICRPSRSYLTNSSRSLGIAIDHFQNTYIYGFMKMMMIIIITIIVIVIMIVVVVIRKMKPLEIC